MSKIWMDVDIALAEVPVNVVSLIDDTDFKTREESVTYDQAGMDLVWNFVTTAGAMTQTAVTPTTGGDYDWNSQGNGMYSIEITASGGASINNDTEGFGWFTGFATGVLPWTGPIIGFRAAALNNAMIDGGDNLDVNTVEISGDSVAADNLELMYDTTGYTDETGPASRQQVDNIGAASGAALSYEASADNTGGAIIDSVTIVGSITANLFSDTDVENGTRHQLTHSGNAFDFVYRLPIGGGRTAATVEWRGYLTSSNDTCSMQAYDFGGSSWDTIATIDGTNGTTNGTTIANLLSKHTGTGAELGNVYIRFVCTGQTSPVLNTDLLLVQAVNIGQSVGYANGAIWINTALSNTNTEAFVDGVADNPVSTIAAAKTLSTSVGINDFHILNGSSITLGESTTDESYFGDNWILILNGQTVTGAHFQGAEVSGAEVGACEFTDCKIASITTVADNDFESCTLEGTITLPVGSVYFVNCQHGGTPVLDFGAAVGNTTIHMHRYAGGIEVQNMGDSGTDIMHLDGKGKLTLNANSSGGTINLRGNWEIVDNAGGAITIVYDDQAGDLNDIQTRIPAALSSGNMKSDMLAINSVAASAVNLERSASTIVTGTVDSTVAPTTTVFECDDITEATADHFVGRIIIFTSGILINQATDITDYELNGGKGKFTVTALTEAPGNNDTLVIV